MTAALATLNQAALVTLADCELRIERGLKVFVDVGEALAQIRDSRLYRATHATFEEYCRERWEMGRDYADRMIVAAQVVPTIVSTGLPAPTKESQARELAKVPEPERAEVWRETVERTNGKPTAAAVRAVQQERTQTPGPVDAAATPPAGPGTPTEPQRHLRAVPDSAAPAPIERALDAQMARDSERRAQVRNLTSVLTYLVPRAITPAELAERSYRPVLDEFSQEDLDRAAETMAAIAAMKRGM